MTAFRFQPDATNLEQSLAGTFAHAHVEEVPATDTSSDGRLLEVLTDRDRALEDYLANLRSGGGGPRPATKVVAASNASASSKATADYVCGGSGDQATFQAADDAIVAETGSPGSILATEGRFSFSEAYSMSAGTSLFGFGRQAAEIDLDAGFGAVGWGIEMQAGCSVSGLTIIFNVNDAWAAIGGLGERGTIEDVLIDGQGLVGFYGIYTDDTPTYSRIQRNMLKGCGIRFRRGNYCLIADNTIGHDISGTSLVVEPFAGVVSHHNVIVRNLIGGAEQDGIVIDGDDNIVQGNIVDGAGQIADNTKDGITVSGFRNNVQGNTVRKGSGVVRGRYGINVLAGSTDAFVSNNDLKNGGQTGSFNNAGTTTTTAAGNRL